MAEKEILLDGQIGGEVEVLMDHGDAERLRCLGRIDPDFRALNEDRAGGRRIGPRDGSYERRFPAPF